MPFATDNGGSHVITDGWSGYSQLAKLGYGHSVQSVSKGKDVLNHVHLVVSLLKRWLLGTLQGGVREQLGTTLTSSCFASTGGLPKNRTLLFHRLIQGSVAVPPAPYKVIARLEVKAADNEKT
jgi:hypothetical protein